MNARNSGSGAVASFTPGRRMGLFAMRSGRGPRLLPAVLAAVLVGTLVAGSVTVGPSSSASASASVPTVTVTGNAKAVVVLPNGTKAYVASDASGGVTVIDNLTTMHVSGHVTNSLFVETGSIAASADSSRVYVAPYKATGVAHVISIDTATDTVLKTADLHGSGAVEAVVSPTNPDKVFVAQLSGRVDTVDFSTTPPTVTTLVSGLPGFQVWGLEAVGDYVYLTMIGVGQKIIQMNVNNPSGPCYLPTPTSSPCTINTGGVGTSIAASPDGTRLYTANKAQDTVSVVDISNPASPSFSTIALPAGSGPDGVAVSSDGSVLWVAQQTSGTLAVINTADGSFINTGVPFGTNVGAGGPSGIAAVPNSAGVIGAPLAVLGGSSLLGYLTPALATSSASIAAVVGQATITTSTPSGFFGSPMVYSVSPTLPPGLQLAAATGTISGTPTTVQSASNYTITATDGYWTASTTVSVSVAPPPPTVTFDGNGSTGGSMVTQSSSTPTALTLNGFTRTGYCFAGWSPAAGGPVAYADTAAFPFSADTTLYAQWVSCSGLSAVVATTGVLMVPTTAPPTTGLAGASNWTISPTLPNGLTINPATGVISGTPTTPQPPQTYALIGTGATSGTVGYTVSITVNGTLGLYTVDSPTAGVPMTPSTPPTVGGLIQPVTWSISPTLPNGMLIDSATGVISGTPTTPQSPSSYTVTATDANGLAATTTAIFGVNGIVNPLSGLTATVGTAFMANAMTVYGTTGTVLWSVSPTLPAGLTLNPATGAITGTPSAVTASATYTMTASDGSHAFTAGVTLAVIAAQTAGQVVIAGVGAVVKLALTGIASSVPLQLALAAVLAGSLTVVVRRAGGRAQLLIGVVGQLELGWQDWMAHCRQSAGALSVLLDAVVRGVRSIPQVPVEMWQRVTHPQQSAWNPWPGMVVVTARVAVAVPTALTAPRRSLIEVWAGLWQRVTHPRQSAWNPWPGVVAFARNLTSKRH